jgi:Transposase, Mutator family
MALSVVATYLKQREGGRVVSVAAIIAVAVNTDGKREIVGLHIGCSEAETFWSVFLKSLSRRGLRGVKLVLSDAHEGLKAGSAGYPVLHGNAAGSLDAECAVLRGEDAAEHGGSRTAPGVHPAGSRAGQPDAAPYMQVEAMAEFFSGPVRNRVWRVGFS